MKYLELDFFLDETEHQKYYLFHMMRQIFFYTLKVHISYFHLMVLHNNHEQNKNLSFEEYF